MIIGVPRETHHHEHRVGLAPFAMSRLVQQGHTVIVEKQAGEAARFTDRKFQETGAQIVYNPEEVYGRADIVCRVGALSTDELALVRPGSTICAFHHVAVMSKEKLERLMALKTTLIGYEVIQDRHGDLPVLYPISEMAGHMAVNIAAHLLQKEEGGRGVLLGAVAGVPPPTVVILGAGAVGHAAARQADASGAHVIVLDSELGKMRSLHREFGGRVITAIPTAERLMRYTSFADVLIGAVLIPGARAPFIVTEAMVKGMKPGSVILDISIDQGGCIETSRPTTLHSPTFSVNEVVHYCVPNMTANIPRTASRALSTAALPYFLELAGRGPERALKEDAGLAAGVYLWRGEMVNEKAGAAHGIAIKSLQQLLQR